MSHRQVATNMEDRQMPLKGTIHLKDLADMATPDIAGNYTIGQIANARKTVESRDLRYCIETGITRDCTGELARYCNKSDVPIYDSLEDVMRWEFRGFIGNSASRVARGFSA